MARARRWVGDLREVEMRWISEVGVRWGRDGGDGNLGEVLGDDFLIEGVERLGEVVEIWRMEAWVVLGWGRRWRGREGKAGEGASL